MGWHWVQDTASKMNQPHRRVAQRLRRCPNIEAAVGACSVIHRSHVVQSTLKLYWD